MGEISSLLKTDCRHIVINGTYVCFAVLLNCVLAFPTSSFVYGFACGLDFVWEVMLLGFGLDFWSAGEFIIFVQAAWIWIFRV